MPAIKSDRSNRGREFGRRAIAGLLMVGAACSGCAGLPLLNAKTVKYRYADPTDPAREILAIWQEAEGPDWHGVPVRGFGGQIYFFTQGQMAPVLVDGSAKIYLFDDRGTPEQRAKPLHVYDFSRESWTAHVQGSHLGPAYTVFIPYPRDDFHRANCSLRLRFNPTVGPVVYSIPSTVVLAGPPLKSDGSNAGLSMKFPSPAVPHAFSQPPVRTSTFATESSGATEPPFGTPARANVPTARLDQLASRSPVSPLPQTLRLQTAEGMPAAPADN